MYAKSVPKPTPAAPKPPPAPPPRRKPTAADLAAKEEAAAREQARLMDYVYGGELSGDDGFDGGMTELERLTMEHRMHQEKLAALANKPRVR